MKLEDKNLTPFIRLLIKLGCVNMTKSKNKFWVTDKGYLMRTTGNMVIKNAEEVTEYKYRKLKKETAKQQVIAEQVEQNGCYIDEEDNVYI